MASAKATMRPRMVSSVVSGVTPKRTPLSLVEIPIHPRKENAAFLHHGVAQQLHLRPEGPNRLGEAPSDLLSTLSLGLPSTFEEIARETPALQEEMRFLGRFRFATTDREHLIRALLE